MGHVNTILITSRRDEYPVYLDRIFRYNVDKMSPKKSHKMKVYVELNGMPREIAGGEVIEVECAGRCHI